MKPILFLLTSVLFIVGCATNIETTLLNDAGQIRYGLLQHPSGGTRAMYSLRHTFATEELLAGTDIHTLSEQMGTSVRILEAHYSKLTATMAAERLA